MKEGDEKFERLVTMGVVIVFIISAIAALFILALLGMGLLWVGRGVL